MSYPHTLRFSDTLCLKNALNTFSLKLHFFPLDSFYLPRKHFLIFFRQTSDQKWTKNLPKGGKNFFPFFIIFFTFSLFPYGKKQNHLLFPPFLSLEIEKPQGKTSHKKFFSFFLYLTFLDLTAPRNQKYYHLPFFQNFDLKCPKKPLSALKFNFLEITFFSAVITRTHNLPTHTPFFRHIMSKKRALHLFLKITFFWSVLLFLTPKTLPNHRFRQTNHQK